MEKRSFRQESRKIGVMGGTFNPVHAGHLMLAEWAREAAGLDQIIFMPAGHPYMKDTRRLLDGKERLHMVALAVEDNPAFTASGMEISREGYTYTCDTVEQLKKEHPDAEIYFIMGADCLYTIENWRDPERIFRACHVIAAARNGASLDAMEQKCRELTDRFHAEILLLQFPALEISSTDIRKRVSNGHSIRYLVPEKVREYIIKNRLYRE